MNPLVLSIGSPEFFMLALLGITFVASLSGRNLLKGLAAGCLGLALATVGLDPIRASPRFTFEGILGENASLFLWDGVSLVAVAIGLFAIPEIVDLAIQGTSIAREKVGKLGGVWQGVKDTFHHFWLVIRCSAIGTYIGILPGIGGGAAQWIAYAHAVQSSPAKERFGKGAVEGVLGPGAANNSKDGGALVPTVAFGVPGSVSMAILLGAFLIHGIVPGPDMLDPAKHLPLTFSFVWIIVIGNIITVSVCFLFLNQLAKITYIRGALLVPFLLLLIYLGGFTVKNSFGDMILVLIFGALGWFMIQFDWQRPPLLLGLVLGTIAERNLFISTRAYGAGWLMHPGVIVIGLLILGAILYSALQIRKDRIRSAAGGPQSRMDIQLEIVVKNPTYRVAFALFCVGLFAYILREAFYEIRPVEEQAALFPIIVGVPGLAFSGLVLGQEFLRVLRQADILQAPPDSQTGVIRRRALSIIGWTLGFFAVIWLLGFSIAGPVATLLYLKLGSGEKWGITLVLSFLMWVFFYGLFDHFLHLPFPEGELFHWFN